MPKTLVGAGDPDEFDPYQSETHLVAALMSASHNMTTSTSNRVTENLQRDNDRLRAELDLIHQGIIALCSGDWMPAPHRIVGALYPPREAVDQAAEELRRLRNDGL